jgi:4-hydroxy-tetrahydrodipicolinate synthase
MMGSTSIKGGAMHGVYVPLLTAFTDEGEVDAGACAAHAEWVAARGVQGLVPFGSSGEGPSLSLDERLRVLDRLAAALPHTPMVATLTESSLDTARRTIAAYNDRPLEAVMILPPYYFRPVTAAMMRAFLEPLIAASRHPVLLYHIPEFGPAVPVEVVAGLPVWGVKDSGGDLAYTREVLAAGRNVMVGAEHTIVDAVLSGARGTIAGFANVLPEHLVAAVAGTEAGTETAARAVLAEMLAVRDDLMSRLGPMQWVMALKQLATERHGIPLGAPRPPIPPVAPATVAATVPALRAALQRLAAVA